MAMNGKIRDDASVDTSDISTHWTGAGNLRGARSVGKMSMAIALDTNILWPLLDAEEPAVSILTPILDGYNATDGLVICAPVYAELLAGPGATTVALDAFLDAMPRSSPPSVSC